MVRVLYNKIVCLSTIMLLNPGRNESALPRKEVCATSDGNHRLSRCNQDHFCVFITVWLVVIDGCDVNTALVLFTRPTLPE